jgi:hypothetical protein
VLTDAGYADRTVTVPWRGGLTLQQGPRPDRAG